MAQNDIDSVLDHLRRIKSGGDVCRVEIDEIETLEMELKFLRTFLKYHHVLCPDSFLKIIKKAKLIVEMLVFGGIPDDMERLVSQLREFIEGKTSSTLNYELDDFYLLEYMDYLDKNLNDAPRYLAKFDPFLIKQIKILQKKMRFLRYLYRTEINGYVDHEKLKGLLTRIKFMAKNVGHFCLALWVNEDEDAAGSKEDKDDTDSVEDNTDSEEDEDDTDSDEGDTDSEEDEDDTGSDEGDTDSEEDEDDTCSDEDDTHSKEDGDDTDSNDDIDSKEVEDEKDPEEDGDDTLNIESKPPYLLFLVVLVELEMKRIFLGEFKASKYAKSRTFKDKKLPKGFSHHLYSLLMYLRHKNLKNFLSARNIDVEIEFLLVFLADVPNHVYNGKSLNEVLAKIGVIVGNILCITQMLLGGSTIKEDASKIDLGMIQILEEIEDLKAQVEERYKSLKYSPSNEFPTVGGLSFLDSLLRKLNDMLKSESSLDCMVKPHIGIIEEELSSLKFIFRDVAKVQHKHDEILKDLQRRTVHLAHEAEVSIDSILGQYNALWHFSCSLPGVIKEIKDIRAKVMEMRFQDLPLKPFSVVEPFKHLPTQYSNPVNDEEIVGLENEAEKIIHYLIRGTNELDVVPIVGMGGQGKTTVARKVYNNDMIVSFFDVRAWCIISQTYNRRELLQEIFSQVTSSKDKGDKDDILADELRRILMGKRYLIVLDDMWDCMAWDDLRLSFPNDGNGSRIIVTTRLEKVGEYVMHRIDPYFLPFLPLHESCKLLHKKVFQQEDCPLELQDVSLEIAEKCKGLPLVIILVAGIIKRNKMKASWWNEVKNSLLSYLHESEGYSLSTMQLSYDNLPDYLKPCLLYMGMFPEDKRIPVSKLISLWIAEGFVQNIESGRLMEEAAEDYLMDLIGSNVVMVSRRRYNGKVKECQVHDVVLHFCLEKSREERFMLAVKGQFQPSEWKGSRVSFSFSNGVSKFPSLGSKTQKPFHHYLRSLIKTNQGIFEDWNIFHKCSKLRLLMVLDLSSHGVCHLSSVLLKPLIHLKYLAVTTEVIRFSSESNLPPLETLIVAGLMKYTTLPTSFWKMKKLRHVDITWKGFDLEEDKQGMFEESSKLENLRILRGVKFPIDEADRVDVLLRRCPNLQELDISFKGGICPKLETLTQLQVLRLSFKSSIVLSGLQLLSNLKKLVISGTHIESVISVIARLPSLEYLQLRDFPQSKEWCLGDITLHKLKFLKLMKLDITRWDASEESFPLLETLVIKWCDELEEIPFSFADIPTLKRIKLIASHKSFLEDSAERIKESVEENEGCDRIDLMIDYW